MLGIQMTWRENQMVRWAGNFHTGWGLASLSRACSSLWLKEIWVYCSLLVKPGCEVTRALFTFPSFPFRKVRCREEEGSPADKG